VSLSSKAVIDCLKQILPGRKIINDLTAQIIAPKKQIICWAATLYLACPDWDKRTSQGSASPLSRSTLICSPGVEIAPTRLIISMSLLVNQQLQTCCLHMGLILLGTSVKSKNNSLFLSY